GESVCVFAGRGADDQVLGAPLRLVALGLERFGERVRLLAGRTLDAHLPGSETAVELLLLPRLARRLVVPAILLVEPVLDLARLRLDAVRAKLGLDHEQSLLGRRACGGVDVDGAAVARDREAVRLESLCELACLFVEVAGEPVEEAGSVLLFVDLDRDAPVVVRHRGEPSLRGWIGASGTSARRSATRPARRGSSTSGSSCSSLTRRGRPGCVCSWTTTARGLWSGCGVRRGGIARAGTLE